MFMCHAHWWEKLRFGAFAGPTSKLLPAAMSDYFQALEPPAKERYIGKLKILGLTEKDDPYASSNDSKFSVNDMTIWPPVEYGHIFCYFIERPGVYTQKELMRWKSLDAYNYFVSGHVREVKLWAVSSSTSILRALVNPSQRAADGAHHAWVAVKGDGQIITAHCTCMAGLGEGCSHVAAILFKVDYAVRNGYTSVTSHLCSWNQLFTKKHSPAEIVNIDFTQPKKGGDCRCKPEEAQAPKRPHISPPTVDEKNTFLQGLEQILPDSAILLTTSCRHPQIRDATSSVRRVLPALLTSLYHPRYKKLQHGDLLSECKQVFETKLKVTEDEVQYLAQSTCLQSKSMLWFEHRKGRLTASQFASIFHTHVKSPSKSLLRSILHRQPLSKVAAVEWGIGNESRARKDYILALQDQHIAFKVEVSGLHINPEFPHLGASPDGLISCSCCGDGILEVKCPYSKRHISPAAIGDEKFYLKPTDGGLKLSQSHNYYYQIQGQMAVCRRSYCDFVCWTPHGIHIERIHQDLAHWNEVKPRLDNYFVQIILPALLSGPDDKENGEEEQVYCTCRKGECGQMIACDNPSCKYEWFHLDCMHLTSVPDGEWFCPDCK